MSQPTATSRLVTRPAYAGANIRTWIGFKHFTYLVEAAVLQWFRDRGCGPGRLYHEHGLGLSVIDCSLLLPHVLDVDDEVVCQARFMGGGRFSVRLLVAGVSVCRARVAVVLVREKDAPGHQVPPGLDVPVVDAIGPQAPPISLPAGADPLDVVRGARETFGWSWRAPYFCCQYSDRVAHSGYVRALEETVERFLADRHISVGRMLVERGWIPVVSRSRVRLLADAHMEETILTTFRVEEVLRGLTYDARMDCHVARDGRLVPVATARIMHGYAVSRGPTAGQLAELDPPVLAALTGAAVSGGAS